MVTVKATITIHSTTMTTTTTVFINATSTTSFIIIIRKYHCNHYYTISNPITTIYVAMTTITGTIVKTITTPAIKKQLQL